ncbi:MAG: hydroxyacid dehydrogenase [Pyramidobacter sp.]|nr:hydroxyacid dehydrogenase [Pyramidobacter sp.]
MNVFLCESIHPEALALLRSRAEIISSWDRLNEADAIVNRNLKLPSEVLCRAERLKTIAVHGTGSDGIDLDWCRNHDVCVTYVPYENADSVAELIVAFALCLLRKIPRADRLVLSGAPIQNAPPELFGNELRGKTLGLVGTGDIARRAARIMKDGFGVSVIGYSPSLNDETAQKLGIRRCASVTDVMRDADIISVGVHLTPQTEHMISAAEFAAAKPTAVLINTSRGGVVDEAALYEALTTGKIAAAACDVWESEPPTRRNPLVGLDSVLATPHIGANTDEALRRVGLAMVRQIFDVLDGKQPRWTYSADRPKG